MGLTVDLKEARALLDDAVAWALSQRPVPEEWIKWTNRIDASPSKTFTAAFGTALLAKATNPDIDALALKATSGPNAYSARSVGHKVLVPGAIEHGYSIRATGREPLNNQPFFRYDRIDEIDRIHSNARPFLPDLIEACREINRLDASDAQAALAAFLRVRIEAARTRQAIDLQGTGTSMRSLIERAEAFITSNTEGGRRGQAFVAAAFDLASPDVRSSRVNDPSRRFPGDVQVLKGGIAMAAVEVRQKIVTHVDALQFAEGLKKGDIAIGLIAMLHPDQHKLDEFDLLADAEGAHNVAIAPIYGVHELLMSAAVWCGKSLATVLADFPQNMLTRLEEIDADIAGIREWEELFASRAQ